MKLVLGIDFGTTNTVGAYVDAMGEVQTVPVRNDSSTLPSVVGYRDNGGVLVGDSARELVSDNPGGTIYGVKRFLGRRFLSDFVGRHRDRFAFKLVEGDDTLTAVDVFGQTKSLEEVAFQILSRIVELSNIAVDEPFEECVISVPAHFTYRQRQVIRRVAERLLDVKAMINEPTAAALYYAMEARGDQTVLVYDLGGGTFDATVLKVHDGLVEVLATGGDAFLGGADFDERVVEYLLEGIERDFAVDLSGDDAVKQRLTFAAENAKIALSSQDSVEIQVPCVVMREDSFIDLHTWLTRTDLETICAPLIERTLGISERIVERAQLKPADLDALVLVGGQTRMPEVQRRLSSKFPFDPDNQVDPEMAVAAGAALLGAGASNLVDVLSVPVGVMAPGMAPQIAVPEGTALPGVKRVPIPQRPTDGRRLTMVMFEAMDVTSIDRDILGSARVPAEWLDQNPGNLALEVRVNASFGLALTMHASEGGKLPLELLDDTARPVKAPRTESESAQSATVARAEKRVSTAAAVQVRKEGGEFRAFDADNLSATGMFIRMAHPYPRATRIEMQFETKGGWLSMHGQVARVVDVTQESQSGQSAGIGVQFVGLTDEVLRKLRLHLADIGQPDEDDLEIEIDFDDDAEPVRPVNPLDVVRRFLTEVAQSNLYAAIDVSPLALDKEVRAALVHVEGTMQQLAKGSGPVRERLKTAAKVLARTKMILLDPRKRLAYDFKCGHVHAEERLAQSEAGGPAAVLLREAWHRSYPERVEEAAMHLVKAVKSARSGAFQQAVISGQAALQLDPFNLKVRQAVKQWTAQAVG